MTMIKRLAVLAAVLLLSACSRDPMPEAFDSLSAAVETDEYYFFEASQPTTDVCYIYFPGGLVKEQAYAPYLKAVADAGVHAFLLRPILDMALWDVGLGEKARQSEYAQKHCQQFVMGGHSLGGLAIIEDAEKNPDLGLLFLSAYIHKDSIKNHTKPVMMVYGSNDLLTTEAEFQENAVNAPEHTIYRPIAGGNHGQMGYYGEQGGDGVATISREEQQQLLLQHTLEIIGLMKNAKN